MAVRIGPLTVMVNGEMIKVRPTLAAAAALDQGYGDVGRLAMNAYNRRFSAVFAAIEEGAVDPDNSARLRRAASKPLAGFYTPEVDRFLGEYLPALMCIDLDNLPDPSERTEPASYSTVIADLFAKATGWLGWSPTEAWNSTPGEIIAALNAHVEKLKLQMGVSDATSNEEASAELDRAGLDELKTLNTIF